MPHLRKRYLESLIQRSCKFSSTVGIFGHRQVGKTTLASGLAQKYVTLDDPTQSEEASSDPKSFLKNHSARPLVIDECQLVPPLFPVIKDWVRVHPQPGQFLLTGSVRFSSRKAIRESLTGRIIAWELLPMNLSEAHSCPLRDSVLKLIQAKTVDVELELSSYFTRPEYEKYLSQGGLPGVFAVRDVGVRRQKFESQIDTILERDLRLIVETSLSLRILKNFVKVLALNQNQPLELSFLARQTRISIPTLRKLIGAFEAMFLIRLIETEGTEKKPVLFFEDQGEATYLSGDRYDDLTQMTRFIFAQIRQQWIYRPEIEGSIFQYRTRGGALVPLCVRSKNGELGILPILEENPSASALASARSFLNEYPRGKVVFVHFGDHDEILNPRLRTLNLGKIV